MAVGELLLELTGQAGAGGCQWMLSSDICLSSEEPTAAGHGGSRSGKGRGQR
jgi:hypothetical protein